VATPNTDFQPMNVTFGLFDALYRRVSGKRRRGEALAARALDTIEALRSNPLAGDYPEQKICSKPPIDKSPPICQNVDNRIR
jgi:hypothetical protein